MESEPDEDTVVRPPQHVVADPADVDADTVIRERDPFADVPREALVELRPPAVESPAVLPPARPPAPIDETTEPGYSFAVNAHEPIGLDAPALIGRRPSLPRIMAGRPPRLIRVPSPLREVSSTHLELRQQGALVIVTDLRSTNGTVVMVPGRAAVKLRQGESVVVGPGAVIDIGDRNLVEILPARPARPIEGQE